MKNEDAPTEDARATADDLSVGGQVLRAGIERRLFGVDPEPARLGRFRLLEVLGRGAMGVVYEAYDPTLDRKVAVKILTVGSDEATQRLLREAKALARLNHPNVVTIHEVGEHGGEVFVAMEYVDGGTLRSWCLEHPPGTAARARTVLRFARQAIHGLAAAHAIDVVHRDVKPANMLIGRDGRLRLADFGLARSVASPDNPVSLAEREVTAPMLATMTGAAVGTPAYMAPEQFEGRADARSDQFGFCMSFYEALYGVRAYEGETVAALLESIERGRVATAPEVSVPAHVRRVLLRGLSPDPAERFESMHALGDALKTGARRRRIFVGLGAGLVGTTMAFGAVLAFRPVACSNQRERIDAVVGTSARQDLHEAIRASGRPYPEELEQRTSLGLDALASRWSTQQLQACRDSRDADPEVAAVGASRLACLDGALKTTRQTLAELNSLTVAQANALPTTLEALLDVSDCTDADRETYDNELGRALVGRLRDGFVADASFDRDGARKAFEEILSRSEPGRFSRLRAEAHIKLTEIYAEDDDRERFRTHTVAALDEAEAAGDPELVALAWMFMIDLLPEDAPWSTVELFLRRVHRVEQTEKLSQQTRGTLAFNDAQIRFHRGRYDEASRRVRDAIEIGTSIGHPLLPYMHVIHSNVLITEGHPEEALRSSQTALDLLTERLGAHHPDVATLLLQLGHTQAWLSRDDEAIATYGRSIEVLSATPDYLPDNLWNAYVSRADAMRNVGRYDDALEEYERALAYAAQYMAGDPDAAADTRLRIARTHAIMERPAEALELVEQALPVLDGGDERYDRQALLEALLLRAIVLADLGRDEESAAQLDEARPLLDEVYARGSIPHMQAIQQIADTLARTGGSEEAQRELSTYLDNDTPADPTWTGLLQAARARVHLEAGERDDARSWANRSLSTLREAKAGAHEISEVERLLEKIDAKAKPTSTMPRSNE